MDRMDGNFDASLAPIGDTEFKVADGEPDPRGWDVRSADGRTIGEVEDLIVDKDSMKVRYLVCDLDEDELGTDTVSDRRILIPVGYARLNRDDENVDVDRLTATQATGLPAFTGIASVRDCDTAFTSGHTAGATDTTGMTGSARERFDNDANEQRITRSEEELRVGKREVQAGEVDIHKHVETEHVSKPVSVRHDEVEVERRPVNGMTAGDARIGEEEIRVPITEEEVVVDTRPVVKEELVVRKRDVVETENVEADVRRERVDVEGEGNVHEDRQRGV